MSGIRGMRTRTWPGIHLCGQRAELHPEIVDSLRPKMESESYPKGRLFPTGGLGEGHRPSRDEPLGIAPVFKFLL